jgi:hypothetical protein
MTFFALRIEKNRRFVSTMRVSGGMVDALVLGESRLWRVARQSSGGN